MRQKEKEEQERLFWKEKGNAWRGHVTKTRAKDRSAKTKHKKPETSVTEETPLWDLVKKWNQEEARRKCVKQWIPRRINYIRSLLQAILIEDVLGVGGHPGCRHILMRWTQFLPCHVLELSREPDRDKMVTRAQNE